MRRHIGKVDADVAALRTELRAAAQLLAEVEERRSADRSRH
jgi:hypothetical protein